MKLSKKNMVLVSFMLFSLFFGAGNLIFPPFLGQNAGNHTPLALLGFLFTAVILPVLGVIVVAKFNGLDSLARKVDPRFGIFFTVLIYLSIGPGLGIPRAASVPFEMAIAPYLPESAAQNSALFMFLYSAAFFLIAGWLAMSPKKLVDRVGKVLTPSLLALITILFISFLVGGKADVAAPQVAYQNNAVVTGFLEGYNTMDAIAALNFGLVIATTLQSFKLKEKKDIMNYTVRAGVVAGTILAVIYAMLSYMGMKTSSVYPLQDNGAWTLRCIVHQLFGEPGAILLAVIFTLACLTTCVGLITSISQYFSTLFKKLDYKKWVFILTFFSFVVCNRGLNALLSFSVPILNAIYPVAIILIVLGLCDKWLQGNRLVYPLTVGLVGVVSIIYALDGLKVPLGIVGKALSYLPFYSVGMGWVVVALVSIVLSVAGYKIKEAVSNRKFKQLEEPVIEEQAVID